MNVSMGKLIALIKSLAGGQGAGGGASSWNDLTDKPFYTEVVEKEIANVSITIEEENTDQQVEWTTEVEIAEGDTLRVTVDGIVYQCNAWYGYDGMCVGDSDCYYGGDGSYAGNGEPFAIEMVSGRWIALHATPGTHTVSVVAFEESVHTLDEKFLPEHIVNKPVVFTYNSGSYVQCNYTAAEVNALIKQYNTTARSGKGALPNFVYARDSDYGWDATFIGFMKGNPCFLQWYNTTNFMLIYITADESTGLFTRNFMNFLPDPNFNNYPFLVYSDNSAKWVDSFNPVIADSAGAKWKLIVGTDGTLSTEAVTE